MGSVLGSPYLCRHIQVLTFNPTPGLRGFGVRAQREPYPQVVSLAGVTHRVGTGESNVKNPSSFKRLSVGGILGRTASFLD